MNQFVIFLGVVVECYGVVECVERCSVGYTMYDLPKSVCVACDFSVHLDVPSICFVCDCISRMLSPHLRISELTHMCFVSLCDCLQLLCILPFGILCLSAIRIMFVKILLAVCMLVCFVVWAKADSVSSVYCVQSAFS